MPQLHQLMQPELRRISGINSLQNDFDFSRLAQSCRRVCKKRRYV
uniref:Transposase n=1 Tax=Macrostomum lignano TaxID=282301 RepID=A0A1I8FBT6_9PLAT